MVMVRWSIILSIMFLGKLRLVKLRLPVHRAHFFHHKHNAIVNEIFLYLGVFKYPTMHQPDTDHSSSTTFPTFTVKSYHISLVSLHKFSSVVTKPYHIPGNRFFELSFTFYLIMRKRLTFTTLS